MSTSTDSITVIEDACRLDPPNGGIVVLQSSKEGADAFTELEGAEARRMAIMHAQSKGVPDPRINNNVQCYAVDADGQEITNPKTQKMAAVRVDVSVTRRLI